MSCSNCFNGCAEIVSDKCVKYTGINIPALGIETGDNLLIVENKITEKILTLMDGSGIYPKLNPADICTTVSKYFPCCPPLNLNVILTAFVKAICDIDTRLDALKDRVIVVEDVLVALNSPYTLPLNCLTGVTTASKTHDVLQATINALCALATEVHTLYVLKSEVNTYIANYLATNVVASKYYNRMIPYAAVPYFGDTSVFASDGTGIPGTVWEKIYLCNGNNGTPDLRGVVIAGCTNINGAAFDPKVAPGVNANPSYTLGSGIQGDNLGYLLTKEQLAPHTHLTTVVINDPGHVHVVPASAGDNGEIGGTFVMVDSVADGGTPVTIGGTPYGSSTLTGLKGTAAGVTQNVLVTNTMEGASAGHLNIQPTKAANYIMYRP